MNPFQKILQSKEGLRLKLLNGKERKCNASEIQIKNSLFKKDEDDNTTILRVLLNIKDSCLEAKHLKNLVQLFRTVVDKTSWLFSFFYYSHDIFV